MQSGNEIRNMKVTTTTDANEYINIRIPNSIPKVNSVFEYSFEVIIYA